MSEDVRGFDFINRQIASILAFECFSPSEEKLIKRDVQDSYSVFLHLLHEKAFMNLGLLDKKLYREYQELNFNFSAIGPLEDINSQLLLYYLIRSLIKERFFNKRLLEIGSGSGIGLKVSSELLKTEFALGIDLVNQFTLNANSNFYEKNKINYIQSDAEHLPLENESFDIITNLESSHVYPRIENFFSEVDRVLSPGGYFSYSDIHIKTKQQVKKLEAFLKARSNLKVIQKIDITRMIQASIYERIIINEDKMSQFVSSLFDDHRSIELPALIYMAGMGFLPWWKIHLKNPKLKRFVRHMRRISFRHKKYYFYYLIQKVKK